MVNLGNMMMNWTNDRYLSNLHRVINRSGEERYSVVFFYHGNVHFTIKSLPGFEDAPKYAPISVEDMLKGRYLSTYGNVVASEAKPVKAIEERRMDYL